MPGERARHGSGRVDRIAVLVLAVGALAVAVSALIAVQVLTLFGTYAPAINNVGEARISAATAYIVVRHVEAGAQVEGERDAGALLDRARLAVADALAGRSAIAGLRARPLVDRESMARLRRYDQALLRFQTMVARVSPPDAAERHLVERRIAYAEAEAAGEDAERHLLKAFSLAIARQDAQFAVGLVVLSLLVLAVGGVVVARGQRRRAAERALAESEAKYRLLAENISDVIWVLDVETFTFRYMSPSIFRLRGYTAEEVEGQDASLVLSPAALQRIRETLPERLAEFGRGVSQTYVDEVELPRKGGGTVWTEISATLVRNPESDRVEVYGTTRDIGERRRSRAELQESEAGFRRLFMGHPLPMWVYDLETLRFLEVNHAAVAHYGYSRDEFLAMTIADIRPPEDVPRLRSDMEATLIEHGHQRSGTWRHVTRDGRTIDVEINSHEIEHGGHRARLVAATDVTARKAAEDERRRLATAIEQASEAYLITDADGLIEYVNPAFERITGYRAEEAIGRNPRLLKSGRQDESFYAQMWRAVRSGQVWSGRLFNRRKDGSEYEAAMTITPLRDESGTTVGLVGVQRDITAQADLERQLAQAQKMDAVGRLAGGVAHDFNNLLQAMLATAQLLGLGAGDAGQVRESARELEDLVRRAAQLTRQLLLFSRRGESHPETIDLNETVVSVERLLRRLLRANIELRVETAATPLPVRADRGQLEQVLVNLAVNAMDAMPDGGTLAVSTGREGEDDVWLAVEDTGTGIPPEIRERIFEPFFTTKGVGRGTGLGLAVVQGIVASHGGRITVESAVDAGTTFRLTLPSTPDAASAAPGGEGEAARPLGRGERVLLVEDDAAVRLAITRLLERLGYRVEAFGGGEEALAAAAGTPFDALITDTVLPGMSGVDVAAAVRQRWPGTGIVVMSGYSEDEVTEGRPGLEGVSFMQKPVDLALLARVVRETLDRH